MGFKVHFGLDELSQVNNERVSVRAIVKRGNDFLMISTKRGDLIFPGGGIEENESFTEAVQRELFEETGYVSNSEPIYIGEVTNIRHDRFDENKLYKLTMHFFICEVDEERKEQVLSDQEIDLNLQPLWIEGSDIIRMNHDYDKSIAYEDVLSKTTEFIINEMRYRK